MTELEFAKIIIFKKYPLKVSLLVLNEFIGAILVVTGIGAVVPLLGSLIDSQGNIPGKLGEFLAYIGLEHASSSSVMMFLIAVLAGRFVLDAVRGYLAGSIAVDLNQHLKSEINNKVASADWLYFLNEDHGKYIQCMAVESATSSGAVNDLASVVANGVMLLIMLIAMLFFSLYAVVITGAVAIVLIFFSKILMRKSKDVGQERIEVLNKLNNFIIDNKNIMKLVKAEGLERKRSSIAEVLIQKTAQIEKKQVAYALGVDGYNNLFTLIVISLLAYLYLGLNFGDGASLIFNLLLIQRAGAYFGIFQQKRRSMLQKIPSYVSCLDIISEIKTNVVERNSNPKPVLGNNLVFENVTFSYPDGTMALKDINLVLPAKGLAAFIGKSGSGKTTIVDLILGLIHPQTGNIRIDGANINDVDQLIWRSMLTYVPQNAYLIEGSLRENLTLGVADVTDEQIWRALEKTDCAKLVQSLPLGLDTNVKSGGNNFSGGERQKFSMARALLRQSQILILDEPSASLDKNSENEIRKMLETLSKELLVIVITHSPEFIEGIGNVYLINHGSFLWQGNSADLLHSGDLMKLLSKQTGT